jgi:hypothetical protein
MSTVVLLCQHNHHPCRVNEMSTVCCLLAAGDCDKKCDCDDDDKDDKHCCYMKKVVSSG